MKCAWCVADAFLWAGDVCQFVFDEMAVGDLSEMSDEQIEEGMITLVNDRLNSSASDALTTVPAEFEDGSVFTKPICTFHIVSNEMM